jgi:hypothetical protein
MGVLTLLDDWVRKGTVPVGGAITKAFGGDPSVSQIFQPGPWPAGTTS